MVFFFKLFKLFKLFILSRLLNYAVLACMTCSSSSLLRYRTRGGPEGLLVVTTSPVASVTGWKVAVSAGRLFAGICRALVCAAAVYRVLRM